MEFFLNEEAKLYSGGLGQLAKMAAMPIYGKNALKTFSLRTFMLMTLKLCT